MRRTVAVLVAVAGLAGFGPAAGAQERVERVVVFAIPGVDWEMVADAPTPTLDRLIREGAPAAMSVRAASRRTTIPRGYLTLGAGNRAYARGEEDVDLAFRSGASYESGTAAEALARRSELTREGEIVHVGFPQLAELQDRLDYGTVAGSLGEALEQAGIPRAVVTAGDLAVEPEIEDQRRSSVLGIVDAAGTVDHGRLEGLVRPSAEAPFGVETRPEAFVDAVREALDAARAVLVDAGETVRADEFAAVAPQEPTTSARLRALARADGFLGRVLELLGPRDMLLVVAPSGPAGAEQESLTPLVAYGAGVSAGWLTSATTRRDGYATLTDVAPTILDALGVDAPGEMSGTILRVVDAPPEGKAERLVDATSAALARERLAPVASISFIVLLGLLAIGAFVVFLAVPRRRWALFLVAGAFLLLAVPPAAVILRATGLYTLPLVGTVLVLYGLAALLGAAASLVPGPRWSGAVVLLLLSAALHAADLLAGAPWQLDGVFGYSPIVAGRFYGASNLGWTVLYSSAILGLTGLADLRGRRTVPVWAGVVLAGLVLVVGLPMFGANFGGFLGGVPAAVVAFLLARGVRLRWGWVAGAVAAGAALAVGLAAWDLSRPPEMRTHLGRFAGRVAEDGLPALLTILQRKAESNMNLLFSTTWTFAIPIGIAVLILLLWRPRGVLRPVMDEHPALRAGLWGTLAAGLFGFIVNDSGIAIPAMVLAHVEPFLVLMGVETILSERSQQPAEGAVASLGAPTPERAET